MKKLPLLFTCLLLTGCTLQSNVDLQNEITESIATSSTYTIHTPNISKTYYSYYLPVNIGRMQSTSSGNILNDRGRQFVMNLNVSSIINSNYYTEANSSLSTDSLSDPVAYIEGEYTDINESIHSYHISVYKVDYEYLLEMRSDTVEFYSISDALSTIQLAQDMYEIARSIEVNTNAVLATYSNKDTIDYQSEKIELFEQLVPESGRVEELFEDYNDSNEDDTEKNEDGPKQITNVEE